MKDLPKYIFVFVCMTVVFMFGYISHSEKLKEYHKDSILTQNVKSVKNLRDSISLENNIYIGKEDVERYLSSNYAISSYNWTSLLLGVAALVVTLLGWFLWINILETKGHIKEIDSIKDELRKEKDRIINQREALKRLIERDRNKFEKKYEVIETAHTKYFREQVIVAEKRMKIIKKEETELRTRMESEEGKVQSLIKEQKGILANVLKRNDLNDKINNLFLSGLLDCIEKKDLTFLRKNLCMSQLYSTDEGIRLQAAFDCKNYCSTNIQDDILKLGEAISYYESIVPDKNMVDEINQTLEFLKTKKN
jgi:hypothetical protein